MRKLVFVPLELMEERYTKQWYLWFTEYFNYCPFKVYTILPEFGFNSVITNGQFLDVINTNRFKAEQLKRICQLFNDGLIDGDTTFLFMDAWFPGIETLAYIRDGLGIPFKIVGLLHAGTWDDHDFLTQKGMRVWARHLERSWLILMDQICVATQFHKELIISQCKDLYPKLTATALDQKIKVTGFPIFQSYKWNAEKFNYVVFPHRLAPEKNPGLFEQLHVEFYEYCRTNKNDLYKDWIFLKTKTYTNDKQTYYDLLNKSKIAISFADQETFGIAMLESVLCGCYPIVPDKLSYSELYPEEFKYPLGTSYVKCCLEKLIHIIENEDFYVEPLRQLQEQIKTLGMNAIPNIITHCFEVQNE